MRPTDIDFDQTWAHTSAILPAGTPESESAANTFASNANGNVCREVAARYPAASSEAVESQHRPEPRPVSHARRSPEAVYRAYWDAGLSPAEPDVECFMSKGAPAELKALRAEEPEMAEAMLELMAAMHTELNEAAVVGSVEIRDPTDDGVTLGPGLDSSSSDEPELRPRTRPAPSTPSA